MRAKRWNARSPLPDMELGGIENIGERHTEERLVRIGYQCNRNTLLPGSTEIDALGINNKLLVQVKTAVFPNEAADLSQQEKSGITSRASLLGREAWLARVQIDSRGALIHIRWTKFA
jgi:hypothetical protein